MISMDPELSEGIRQHGYAWDLYQRGFITESERDACSLGSMSIQRNEIFNIQHKDTPVPWACYAPFYKGRAEQILVDKLLGLWSEE